MSLLYQIQEAFPDGKTVGNEWYNINCFICETKGLTRDTKYHLGLNYEQGYVHCFRCRTSHKLAYFLKLADTDINSDDLATTFAEKPSIRVSRELVINFPKEFINIVDLFDSRYPSYLDALNYIDKRIGIELALKLNVGFCNISDYANRIVIPMFDEDDTIEYFVARAIYTLPEIEDLYYLIGM